MAIANAKKRKIGNELIDWIYLGIRTGARRSVADYQRLKATDPEEAKAHLTRAVNMPRRARDRINNWISTYDAVNGAGAGQTFLSECLTLTGTTVTIGELNTELTTLENQAQTIFNNNAGGATLDDIATQIENALEWEAKDWVFPRSPGYTDTPLLDN